MKKIFILIALIGVGFLSCRKMVLRDVDLNFADQHCANNVFDADELGLDCGGADCADCAQTTVPCTLIANQMKVCANGVTLSTKTFTDQSIDTVGGDWIFTAYTSATNYLMIYFPTKPSVTQVYSGQTDGSFLESYEVYLIYYQPSTYDLKGVGSVYVNYASDHYTISSCDYSFQSLFLPTPSQTQSFSVTF